MPTIDELMAGKQPGTVLVTFESWDHEHAFRPFFKSNDGEWFGLDESGRQISRLANLSGWELWQPPKKKVVRYLWVCTETNGIWYSSLLSTEEAPSKLDLKYWIPLEWSATETDE